MIYSTDKNKASSALKKMLNVLSAQGLDGATMFVEKELEESPESWQALSAMADILYLQERYVSALQYCERSLRQNSNNALVWNTKGNVLYKLGRYEEAIRCYNKAIEIEPLFAKAWYNKKLALEIQMKKSTRKISLSVSKAQDDRKGIGFTQ